MIVPLGRLRHLEHFYDHERIERLLFDGALEPVEGMLRPDLSWSGLGIDLKRAAAAGMPRDTPSAGAVRALEDALRRRIDGEIDSKAATWHHSWAGH